MPSRKSCLTTGFESASVKKSESFEAIILIRAS